MIYGTCYSTQSNQNITKVPFHHHKQIMIHLYFLTGSVWHRMSPLRLAMCHMFEDSHGGQ